MASGAEGEAEVHYPPLCVPRTAVARALPTIHHFPESSPSLPLPRQAGRTYPKGLPLESPTQISLVIFYPTYCCSPDSFLGPPITDIHAHTPHTFAKTVNSHYAEEGEIITDNRSSNNAVGVMWWFSPASNTAELWGFKSSNPRPTISHLIPLHGLLPD